MSGLRSLKNCAFTVAPNGSLFCLETHIRTTGRSEDPDGVTMLPQNIHLSVSGIIAQRCSCAVFLLNDSSREQLICLLMRKMFLNTATGKIKNRENSRLNKVLERRYLFSISVLFLVNESFKEIFKAV